MLGQYIDNYYTELEALDPKFKKEQFQNLNSDIADGEPQICFLGTSSMKPGKYRGASAILLYVNGKSLLMDCAEGSYGQIYDHFQEKSVIDKAIMDMKVIFITHIHGDHQLGAAKIM